MVPTCVEPVPGVGASVAVGLSGAADPTVSVTGDKTFFGLVY